MGKYDLHAPLLLVIIIIFLPETFLGPCSSLTFFFLFKIFHSLLISEVILDTFELLELQEFHLKIIEFSMNIMHQHGPIIATILSFCFIFSIVMVVIDMLFIE
uniref:Uncharacterized protein n=1 Tax=Anthurium amnicola TaxID=1678845 RepID=A0A1D1XK35_9ARAE